MTYIYIYIYIFCKVQNNIDEKNFNFLLLKFTILFDLIAQYINLPNLCWDNGDTDIAGEKLQPERVRNTLRYKALFMHIC